MKEAFKFGGMRIPERSEFGARLFAARLYAGLKQTPLAKAVGMSQSTYAELEKKGLGSSKTVQLSAACKVNAKWLADGSGEMLAPPHRSSAPNEIESRCSKDAGAGDAVPSEAGTLREALCMLAAMLDHLTEDHRIEIADRFRAFAFFPDSEKSLNALEAAILGVSVAGEIPVTEPSRRTGTS